jgi:hypothetical protein
MSQPDRAQLLALALGVLPELPGRIDVLSEAGGSFTLKLSSCDGRLLHGFAPTGSVRTELHLLARVVDDDRGRYEVEFEVVETFFHSTTEVLVHLAVTGVKRRKARRTSPRATVSVKATARVEYCATLPRDTELEVRLVDVSATGLAFVSQHELSPGDLFLVAFPLAGGRISAEVRVVRLDPAPYARHRVGCEITEITDLDRKAIIQMAADADAAGSIEHRRPEVIAALAEARERRAVPRQTTFRAD